MLLTPFSVIGRCTAIALLVSAVVACDKGAAPIKKTADAASPAQPSADSGAEAAPGAADTDASSGAVAAAGDAGAAAAATTGTVTGVVKLDGAAPVMPLLDRSRDTNCPQDELRASWVSVGAGGVVRDAVVHFAPGAVKDAPTRARAATVDQKGCLYKPFVVGITAGQKVRVKNSDPTAHNVRGMNGDDQLWNEMHIAQAPDKLLPVDAAPGNAVQLKCDIHPWMQTWVYVSDNALFDITGADGKFTLTGVPAGTYDLEVWHPYLGKKTAKITVKAGATTTAALPAFAPADYKAPPQ